jgi:hypothetical protein
MATFNEIYQNYLQNPYAGVNAITPLQGIGSLQVKPIVPTGVDSNNFAFSVPTKEESEATLTEGMTDVGENKGLGSLGSMAIGGILSAINPVLGMAYSLADPNSMTRQALASIGFNPTTEGSIGSTDGPFGGYGGFDGTEGSFGSVDTQAQSEASMSEGMSDVGDSSGGVDSAGDGGDGYAYGGRVGFSNGSSGQDYWITVQEMYDNAGGEAGTGLGLIDFANKYFPKMATGGRAGYLQGGLVSLLR